MESPDGVAHARPFTQVILLDESGADTAEWEKTYTDLLGRTTHTLNAAGAMTESGYNASGQLASQTDPDGVTVLYAYDARGRLDTTAIDMDRDGVIDFDGADRITETVVTVADRDGTDVVRTVTLVHTAGGDADAKAEVSRFESSTDGLQTWSTVDGLITHTETIHAGAGNSTTVVTYPDLTKSESIALGGRLRSTAFLDPSGAQVTATSYDYDDLGRMERVSDARNGDTVLAYYVEDRLRSTSTPDPDGDEGPAVPRVTSLLYDIAGRRDIANLPDGGVVDFDYYPTGELHSVSGARIYSATYSYDHAGRLESMRAGAGTTTWEYGPLTGYLEAKVDDDGRRTSYGYTPAGRPESRTLARGLYRKLSYDRAGRLEGIAYFTSDTEAEPDTTTPPVAYTYDRAGRVSSRTDAAGLRAYSTTPTGRVELETIAGGLLDGATIDPGYDALGRRESLAFGALGADGLTHSYRYDAAGRYHQVAAGADPANSPRATYTYHVASNLLATTTSGGRVWRYPPDAGA